MTHRDCTETRDLLAAFYDDELPCETSYMIQEHLERCDPCRAFGRLEQGFTRAARRGLGHVDPPAGTFDRVRARLDEADRLAGASRGGEAGRARWSRAGYAAAAAVLAGVLMLPVVELYAPGSVSGIADAIRGVRTANGVLVCLECLREGVPIEAHSGCRARGHRTGVLCDQTGAWSLVAGEAVLRVLNDPSLRGEPVVVEGRFLEDIRYVEARSIRLASR